MHKKKNFYVFLNALSNGLKELKIIKGEIK